MANTPTTSASVASRLTDEEIQKEADFCESQNADSKAAVLRDYVRMRRLAKTINIKYSIMVNSRVTATINGIEYYQPFAANEVNEIKRLLAEAEKGDVK